MITLLSVTTGKATLGGLFIGWNSSDWHVSAVARNHRRINACQIIIIVRLLVNLRAGRAPRQRVEDAVLLHKSGVGSSTITDSPSVVFQADSPRQHWRRNRLRHRVKLDVVKAHRIAATFGAVVNASYGYDVIETRTNLCIHTGQAELRRRNRFIRLSRADKDLRLDSHAV